MTTEPNRHEARELSLYATNNGPLRFGRIDAIINNLARKVAKGTYEAAKALPVWQSLADDMAKAYAKEFCGPDFDPRQFSKATSRASPPLSSRSTRAMTQATVQHTPGEWYATPSAGHEAHGQSLIIGEGGATVAIAYGVNPGDAALIAAAPAMLAALERFLGAHNADVMFGSLVAIGNGACADQARAAIAQARGEG